MATMEATRLHVVPGYYEEAIAVCRQMGAYAAAFDGAALLRLHEWHVTDHTPELSLQLVFHDAITRARVLDRMRNDGVRNPLRAALTSARPPATVARRHWFETTHPEAIVPLSSAVTSYEVFKVHAGREPEADVAFAEAEERLHRFGVDSTVWVGHLGTGQLDWHVIEAGFDSFEDLAAFQELSSSVPPFPSPMDYAARAGVVARASWAVATTVAL